MQFSVNPGLSFMPVSNNTSIVKMGKFIIAFAFICEYYEKNPASNFFSVRLYGYVLSNVFNIPLRAL
ncbi:hypothetical protein A7309_21010 [Paenibacillus polymyxa]|nr:hypothetical protein A7309_21010 [Paenibacillus polymyxa]OMF34979.1 hypothetical protein BK134_07010 [Paenibacillus peoriae]